MKQRAGVGLVMREWDRVLELSDADAVRRHATNAATLLRASWGDDDSFGSEFDDYILAVCEELVLAVQSVHEHIEAALDMVIDVKDAKGRRERSPFSQDLCRKARFETKRLVQQYQTLYRATLEEETHAQRDLDELELDLLQTMAYVHVRAGQCKDMFAETEVR